MANIFERGADWMAGRIASYMPDKRQAGLYTVQDYYDGNQRAQLKVKPGQADDNIMQNWLSLAINRSVSMMIGGGLEFRTPEGSEQQKIYLDGVWDANRKDLFLHDHIADGAIFGTGFIKIVPDAITSPYTDSIYPRLVILDPKLMKIEVEPLDMTQVKAYIMEYKITSDGKAHSYKEVTRRATPDDYETPADETTAWIVETWEYMNAWRLIEKIEWPYSFPPILHNKNLPSVHTVYGSADIDQVIGIQDKYNFVQSNNLKINRYHAHPKTWGAGFTKSDKTSWGADEMITVADPNGRISNLEMASDLSASRSIAQDLKQSIFDIARDVDINALTDKLGQMTNFGLRLLYSDALSKTATKRLLYSEAYTELNRRLLILAGYEKEASNPGEIIWGDELPINEREEIELDQIALDLGIIDKASIAERWAKRYGKDWDAIQAALKEQKASESTIGGLLLRNFNQGQ